MGCAAPQGAHPNANLNVLAVPITRSPLFPGVVRTIFVRDEKLVRALRAAPWCERALAC